jgi:hypothetical protein
VRDGVDAVRVRREGEEREVAREQHDVALRVAEGEHAAARRGARDVEARDDYDRLLAYVYRADDGLFVNLEIVAQGYANLLTFPPNVAHVDDFVAAARAAEAADLGLWRTCSG